MNRTNLMPLRTVIGGYCVDIVCRCCFTKYGWAHQVWCGCSSLSELSCMDCQYYNPQTCQCKHPARKTERRDIANEED